MWEGLNLPLLAMNMEEGQALRNVGSLIPEAGKEKEINYLLGPQRNMQPSQHINFHPVRPTSDS